MRWPRCLSWRCDYEIASNVMRSESSRSNGDCRIGVAAAMRVRRVQMMMTRARGCSANRGGRQALIAEFYDHGRKAALRCDRRNFVNAIGSLHGEAVLDLAGVGSHVHNLCDGARRHVDKAAHDCRDPFAVDVELVVLEIMQVRRSVGADRRQLDQLRIDPFKHSAETFG